MTERRSDGGDQMSAEQEEISRYNYAQFIGDDDFLAFRSVLPVGSVAPDAAVTVAATGEPALLGDYWRDGDLVIEFGSLT